MAFDQQNSGEETFADQSGDAPLNRADWLRAACRILVTEGVEAIRITRLTQDLAISRGSFYWHFKNRQDLLDGLVAHWREKNTPAIEKAVAGAQDLGQGILALFDAWTDPQAFDPGLDFALRDWARRDTALEAEVIAADAQRVAAIEGLFRRCGFAQPEAFIRARVIYFAQIGYYTLVSEEPMAQRMAYLESYYRSFTGQDLDPKVATAYRAKYLRKGKDNG